MPPPVSDPMSRARILPLVRRRTRSADREARRISVVTFPDVEVLDVTGPLEVFAQAAGFLRGRAAGYTVEIFTGGARPIVCSSGVKLIPDRTIGDVQRGIDTLLVAGGRGVREAMRDRALLRWIRRAAGRVRRLASVCSGTFLLAEAGLLDGRRATTHWRGRDGPAPPFPQITVARHPVLLFHRRLYTSGRATRRVDPRL